MEFFKIIITSIGSVIALFLMAKLIGNKQMNQMNMFDYINGITIGSIGAELATTSEKDFWKPLVALTIYGLVTYLLNIIASKSIRLRRILEGKSIVLMEKGKLYPEQFKKAKIDLSEFLVICRMSGYFDLSQIHTAIIEHNGQLSFLPTEKNRPVTPNDININPQQSPVMKNIIMDGKILKSNLKLTGYDENYLKARLKDNKLTEKEVFLGAGDNNGNFTFINMNRQNIRKTRFSKAVNTVSAD